MANKDDGRDLEMARKVLGAPLSDLLKFDYGVQNGV